MDSVVSKKFKSKKLLHILETVGSLLLLFHVWPH